MNIITVNPAMRPVCGRTAMVLHLSEALYQHGYTVTLVTSDESDRSILEPLPYNVRYLRMDPEKKSPGAVLDLRKGLRKITNEIKPDIVHTHHRYPAYILKYVSLHHARHITTVHSFLEGKRGFHLSPDAWVSVSNAVRAWLRDKYRIRPGKIEVIRNGAPVAEMRTGLKQQMESDGLSVLAAGRFVHEKGFDVLLNAWRMFREEYSGEASLVIAGAGPREKELRNLADGIGVSVEIVDGSGRMEALYKKANLVVVPSRSEPLSYIVLEAGLQGIPLIVTESGGPAELVKNKNTGLVVPPSDAAALKRALVEAATNYDTMLDIAGRLLAELVEHNSINAMTDAYIRLYTRILNQGS